MLVILNMKAKVFLLFVCSIQMSIYLANSLDHGSWYEANADEENGTDRDQMPDVLGEFDMSYLKCSSEKCELIKGSVKDLPEPGPWQVENVGHQNIHSRAKRKMFLPDNRLRIRENSVGRFPFNSAVAIRVNGEVKCSGVALLRPRFFLTAAHCVQPDDRRKGRMEFKGYNEGNEWENEVLKMQGLNGLWRCFYEVIHVELPKCFIQKLS